MRLLINLLALGRISNLPTVWTNCAAAWIVNAHASPGIREMPATSENLILVWEGLGWLILGASLLYVGGCTLNDAFDQEFDKRHNPTRPIPSGSITPNIVWIAGITEIVSGAVILLEPAGASWIWVAALALCILVYDAVHKKWSGSVWLMGSCRFFLWLCAASAAREEIAPLTWLWSGTIACYVVGISLYARSEATSSGNASRLPLPLLFGPVLLALMYLVDWNNLSPLRQLAVNVAGLLVAWIVYTAVMEMRTGKKGCIGRGVSRLLAGIAACDATAAGLVSPTLAYACLACIPVALLLQKKFAAT
jgi:4-hydroxybenzoate polyprenyltransferase